MSVVVPIYNTETYLGRCLDSLVKQTFRDMEIICVDDGSTDGSPAIIDEFSRRYPDRIVSLKQENSGVGAARNRGLNHARGEYISFVDNDDWIDPAWIDRLYARAREESADIVIGAIKRVDDSGEVETITAVRQPKKKLLATNVLLYNKLSRRTLFMDNALEFPNIRLCDDLATTPKLILLAEKIAFVNRVYYYHYDRRDSLSKDTDANMLDDFFTAVESLYEFSVRRGFSTEYEEELEFIHVREFLLNYMFNYARHNSVRSVAGELRRVERIIGARYTLFKRNRYNFDRSVLPKKTYLGLRLYLVNRLLYIAALKAYLLVKPLLSR